MRGDPLPLQRCCISLGQRYPFGGSTGAPRHCLGALDLLEQRKNGLGKSHRIRKIDSVGFSSANWMLRAAVRHA